MKKLVIFLFCFFPISLFSQENLTTWENFFTSLGCEVQVSDNKIIATKEGLIYELEKNEREFTLKCREGDAIVFEARGFETGPYKNLFDFRISNEASFLDFATQFVSFFSASQLSPWQLEIVRFFYSSKGFSSVEATGASHGDILFSIAMKQATEDPHAYMFRMLRKKNSFYLQKVNYVEGGMSHSRWITFEIKERTSSPELWIDLSYIANSSGLKDFDFTVTTWLMDMLGIDRLSFRYNSDFAQPQSFLDRFSSQYKPGEVRILRVDGMVVEAQEGEASYIVNRSTALPASAFDRGLKKAAETIHVVNPLEIGRERGEEKEPAKRRDKPPPHPFHPRR